MNEKLLTRALKYKRRISYCYIKLYTIFLNLRKVEGLMIINNPKWYFRTYL